MGIPLATGAADPVVQLLAQNAAMNDKMAQLQLGIRFEKGRGVPVDLKRARKLYKLAATTEQSVTHVYVASTRPGKPGSVVVVNDGEVVYGLLEAKIRLEALEHPIRNQTPIPIQ